MTFILAYVISSYLASKHRYKNIQILIEAIYLKLQGMEESAIQP